jgi:hypothetical protein
VPAIVLFFVSQPFEADSVLPGIVEDEVFDDSVEEPDRCTRPNITAGGAGWSNTDLPLEHRFIRPDQVLPPKLSIRMLNESRSTVAQSRLITYRLS